MNERDIAEVAFNNGYEKGYADGKYKVMEEIAFPRLLVRQPELSKKDVEDILMQSPMIIMDKTEIIPIYPYRWIPVSERLPEEYEPVLVYDPSVGHGQYVMRACMCEGGWKTEFDFDFYKNPNITHWMPLPEPPKGE